MDLPVFGDFAQLRLIILDTVKVLFALVWRIARRWRDEFELGIVAGLRITGSGGDLGVEVFDLRSCVRAVLLGQHNSLFSCPSGTRGLDVPRG